MSYCLHALLALLLKSIWLITVRKRLLDYMGNLLDPTGLFLCTSGAGEPSLPRKANFG